MAGFLVSNRRRPKQDELANLLFDSKAMLKSCSGIVRYDSSYGSFGFTHPTVLEYLLGVEIQECDTTKKFSIDSTEGYAQLAKASLYCILDMPVPTAQELLQHPQLIPFYMTLNLAPYIDVQWPETDDGQSDMDYFLRIEKSEPFVLHAVYHWVNYLDLANPERGILDVCETFEGKKAKAKDFTRVVDQFCEKSGQLSGLVRQVFMTAKLIEEKEFEATEKETTAPAEEKETNKRS